MPAGKIYKYPRRLNTRQVKQVQKIVNKNRTFKTDFQFVNVEPNTTGALVEFTDIDQGDDYNQRDTDRILLQGIRAMLSLDLDGQDNRIRVLIVRSKIGPLVLADFPAYNTQPNLDKMQVYYEYYVGTSVADADRPFQIRYKKKFNKGKIPHMKVTYADSVSVTAAQSNPVYLFTVGNVAAATSTSLLSGYIYTNWYDAS